MIIDTHVHIGKVLKFSMPEEMVLDSMEKYNIDFSLVSNIESAELDFKQKELPKEKQIDQVTSLKKAIKFARQNPKKIAILPWVRPYFEKVSDELIKLIEDNRDIIVGMKMHPYHSKVAVDDERMKPYIEIAKKFDLPVLLHTGGCEEAEPIHVWNAAKQNPEVKFIMGHMGLGTDNKEAIELLGTLPNLYGDTAWVPMESTIAAIKKWGSKKMMFGSDNPIDGLDTYHNNPQGDINVYQAYFNQLEDIIGKEAYEDLMYKNAIEIFKLNIKFNS